MSTLDYKVLAVMSGTSLDGIDIIYATYSFNKIWSFEIHTSKTQRYSKEWTILLKKLVDKSIDELDSIDLEYSKYLASVILDFIKQNEIRDLNFISSHGHTALHQPENALTYQIGNRQELADILQYKVICDFRVQDVRYGGQGAPLVPIGDRLLFSNYTYCLNLGGFANISFENNQERMAYDICPVNIVLNYYATKLSLEYDNKGENAAEGSLNIDLLNKLNALSFYNEESPKSLGLEWVNENILPLIESFSLTTKDVLRTYVEHIANQISKVLTKENSEVLITGGGVFNEFLIDRLKCHSKATFIIPNNELVEFKEALIFGLLGVLKERNEINCLKSVTGAKRDHSSGKILIPKKQT